MYLSLFNYLHFAVFDLTVGIKTSDSTSTKPWCETDVINGNKSFIVSLCFDQQLRDDVEGVGEYH